MSDHRARDLTKEMLRRALAVEMGHLALGSSVAELAVPGGYLGSIRHLARGMSRDDCLVMLAHLSLMVRMFAVEVPVGRRDQLLAEVDQFDREMDDDAETAS